FSLLPSFFFSSSLFPYTTLFRSFVIFFFKRPFICPTSTVAIIQCHRFCFKHIICFLCNFKTKFCIFWLIIKIIVTITSIDFEQVAYLLFQSIICYKCRKWLFNTIQFLFKLIWMFLFKQKPIMCVLFLRHCFMNLFYS